MPGCRCAWVRSGFNEAAGIHRRKVEVVAAHCQPGSVASMRPPEFTGGKLDGLPTGVTLVEEIQ